MFDVDDPLPSSHPRETKQQVEARVLEFLVWLADIGLRKNSPLCIIVVSHSAYLRYFLSLLGLCNPGDRSFSNLEIRHLEINPSALSCYLQSPQSSPSPPFVFPPDVTYNPSLGFYQISVSKLDCLYPPPKPFSLILFPSAPNGKEDESVKAALDRLLRLGLTCREPFSSTTFAERVLSDSNRHRWMRNRLIEDGRSVIQAVDGNQRWEATCKEIVHDQDCIVFLLPSSTSREGNSQ